MKNRMIHASCFGGWLSRSQRGLQAVLSHAVSSPAASLLHIPSGKKTKTQQEEGEGLVFQGSLRVPCRFWGRTLSERTLPFSSVNSLKDNTIIAQIKSNNPASRNSQCFSGAPHSLTSNLFAYIDSSYMEALK